LEETQNEFMELIGQPTIPASQEPSLEDTLEAFRQTVNQPFHETKDAIVANTEAIAWVGRTAWSSSCKIQHDRGRGISKSRDVERVIHD
jgi:hypothetical protein